MRFIAGPLNKQLLQNLLAEVIEPCTRVRAAVARSTEAKTASIGLAVLAGVSASVVQFTNPSALRCSPQSRGSWSRRPRKV